MSSELLLLARPTVVGIVFAGLAPFTEVLRKTFRGSVGMDCQLLQTLPPLRPRSLEVSLLDFESLDSRLL